MSEFLRFLSGFRLLALLAAVSVAAFGGLVMIAWLCHWPELIQAQPGWAPVQFNTALGFACCGGALFFVLQGRLRWATGLASVPCGLGSLTLLEHVSGVNLGLDELFIDHYITVATSQPGRMAPNTAICMLLSGLVVPLRNGSLRHPAVLTLAGLAVALTLGLAFAAFSGYWVGLSKAYGWGNLTRMAPQTASAFTVLGLGHIALIQLRAPSGRRWWPAMVFTLSATLTIALWQALMASVGPINENAGLIVLGLGLFMATSLAYAFSSAIQARATARDLAQSHAQLAREVQQRSRSEGRLQLASSVVEATSEGVMITDEVGYIVAANPAFERITGYPADEVIGRKASLLKSDHHSESFYRQMWQALTQQGHWAGEIWNRRKGGEIYPEWLSINRIPARDDQPLRYVSVFRDISAQWEDSDRLRQLAFHDALTGLPNRTLLLDRLQQAVARAQRDGRTLAVAFVDLDGFKAVNDRYGHDVGDQLLQEVAGRIRAQVRRSVDTVARLGGDEFVIISEGVEPSLIPPAAAGLIARISDPLWLRGHEIRVGASLGYALYPEDGTSAELLLQRADTAMYDAKRAGKGVFRRYNDA